MKILPKHIIFALVALVALVLLGLYTLARMGTYNFAADDPHWRPVYSSIGYVRAQSIRAHAIDIKVPDLSDEAGLIKGAGNYQAMCAQCHLSPGKSDTELSRGLYPSPPNLSKTRVDPREAFWTIKHGIKASGMPAWGKSMADADIWNLVALMGKLPELSQDGYSQLVKRSSGHSHAGATANAPSMAHDEMHDHSDMKSIAAPAGSPMPGHQHRPGEEH